jgi:tetratricopeptide (TPR) repeat protein
VFAGGFYHLGYHLNLDENASTEKESVWNLTMIIESGDKYLCTVRLDKTNPFTLDNLIETAVAGYDSNPQQAHNKIIFLLVFDRPEMAYQACKELTEKYPKDWWPRLTLAFMDAAKTNPNKAGDDFAAWVEKYPSFSHYYYLSFFYEKQDDLQKACDMIEKSLEYPIKEEADDSPGARTVYSYASKSIAITLKNNKPDLALRICDAALAGLEKERGKYSPTPYWKPTIQKLKTAISANDVNTIDRWNQYEAWGGSFNPYQAGNTNAAQRIKVGSHFFPSDEDIKASERPFEEIEPLTKEWLSH